MLSRVLSGSDPARAQPVSFPFASVDAASPGTPGFGAAGETGADESFRLRETIQRIGAEHAAERQAAFDAGKKQGEEQARAELQPVLERLHSSISEAMGMRADLRRRAEKDVVQLALLIARRVLHRELVVDENALTAIARVAFERLTRSESYTVKVHPRFAAAVKAALPGTHASQVRIEVDAACAPGTLLLQSAEGVIDASIEVQLEEISRGLTDRLEKT